MRKIISFSLILLLAALSFCSPAYRAYSQNTYISSDRSGVYRISFSGRHADITRYSDRTVSASIDVQYKISAVRAYDGTIVLCCDDAEQNQLIVYIYYFDRDYLDSFAIYRSRFYGNTDFCCDSDSIYLVDHQYTNVIGRYSFQGALWNTYTADDEINQVFCTRDGEVFAVSRSVLYHVGNGLYPLSGDEVSPSLFSVDTYHLASVSGEIYSIYYDDTVYLFQAESDGNAVGACIIGSTLYYPCGTYIYGYDLNSGEKISYYHSNGLFDYLYANGDTILAMNTDSGSISYIDKSEFTMIENHDSVDVASDLYSDNSGVIERRGISSGVYTVDTESFKISNIPDGTSVSVFKKNMRYDGYTLHLYRDNSEKKSGNVGTAWLAEFSDDSGSYTFELAVNGDLTGEGNCNSRDLNLLMDYLIGTADFNGVYIVAADLNRDDYVDVLDLALMKRRTA